MAILAQSQFTIRRLSNGRSMNFYLNSTQPLTQIATLDPLTFSPNYTTSNLIISPELTISGLVGNQMIHAKADSVVWKINNKTITDVVEDTYGASVLIIAPYTLTVTKNMEVDQYLNIECSAIYVDPDTSQEISISQKLTISKVTNAGSSILAKAYGPNGIIFRNGMPLSLTARCDMWRGSTIDDTNVSYAWSINQTGSAWTPITVANSVDLGVTGYDTNTIIIQNKAILTGNNIASFKCDVKDNDSKSSTFNKIVSDTISFTDLSDPYEISVELLKGDSIATGGSVSAKIQTYQGSKLMADDWYTGKKSRFFRYTNTGIVDTTWGTEGYKEFRNIDINESDLLVGFATVFGCDVNG